MWGRKLGYGLEPEQLTNHCVHGMYLQRVCGQQRLGFLVTSIAPTLNPTQLNRKTSSSIAVTPQFLPAWLAWQ